MKTLTVKELINILDKYDSKLPVMLYLSYNSYDIKNIISTDKAIILNAGLTNNSIIDIEIE